MTITVGIPAKCTVMRRPCSLRWRRFPSIQERTSGGCAHWQAGRIRCDILSTIHHQNPSRNLQSQQQHLSLSFLRKDCSSSTVERRPAHLLHWPRSYCECCLTGAKIGLTVFPSIVRHTHAHRRWSAPIQQGNGPFRRGECDARVAWVNSCGNSRQMANPVHGLTQQGNVCAAIIPNNNLQISQTLIDKSGRLCRRNPLPPQKSYQMRAVCRETQLADTAA